MKLLAIDPGAERCGWAVLSEGSEDPNRIKYHTSGIFGVHATGKYQDYRLELIYYWVASAKSLLHEHRPDWLISEIVPPTGGNMPSIIRRQLALTVITTIQAISTERDCPLGQISATTVKKKVGGRGTASKVVVRNGVLASLPELEPRRSEWTGKDAKFDEVDALAIGLAYIGEHWQT